MKSNMGSVDRVIRILIAVAIAILFYLNVISGTVAIILMILAGIFIITGFVGFCPLYLPFGISTHKKKTT
jgi:hypothetical protein